MQDNREILAAMNHLTKLADNVLGEVAGVRKQLSEDMHTLETVPPMIAELERLAGRMDTLAHAIDSLQHRQAATGSTVIKADLPRMNATFNALAERVLALEDDMRRIAASR